MQLEALMLQAVPAKEGTPMTAAPGAPPAPAGAQQQSPTSMLVTFLPILIVLPLFFMMNRRQKKEQEARGKLKRGDKVVTTGGLIGELMEIDERVAKVKIAAGVTVAVTIASVSAFQPVAATETKDGKSADKSGDKAIVVK